MNNVILICVFIALGIYVVINFRNIFILEKEAQKTKPVEEPELISDTTGVVEAVETKAVETKVKRKKPSVKKASKKSNKKTPRRRDL